MADLPFVDTHVHFWDLLHPVLRYDWLATEIEEDPILGNYDAIKSARYSAEDFIGEARFANVSKVVHVQAAVGTPDPVDETGWLQASADALGLPHGIVAYADLTSPDIESVLARHAQHRNLRGIRDLRYDEEYLTSEVWQRGYALLERHGLVCCDDPDVAAMADAAELARKFPGTTLCVDHAGFPRRRDPEYFEEWRRGMRMIASVDNTVVKISGLGMADHRWTIDSIRPWVLACIEAWGPSRAFFGTNWPVDRLFSSYGDVVDAYRELIADFTGAEQEALFFGTAERVFRLHESDSGGTG
jgi:predicted TIM-barrel fold metal-dependent hydrolase